MVETRKPISQILVTILFTAERLISLFY